MGEYHRKSVEFLEWDRGCYPWEVTLPPLAANRATGLWIRHISRGTRHVSKIGPGDEMGDTVAAAVLGVTRQTIHNWRHSDKIKARKSVGRWVFSFSDVRDRYCELNGLPYAGSRNTPENKHMLVQSSDDLIAENDNLRRTVMKMRSELDELLARWDTVYQADDVEKDEDPIGA